MAMLLMVTSLLTGCGGGGSSTPTASTLGGTAAVGYPIVGATISVTCAAGSPLGTTTNSGGNWQVTVTNQTLPCAIQVSGGTINSAANTTSYHSIATAAGTVNVTPLTDLVVANLAGTSTPDIWFTGLGTTPAPLATINQTRVDAALTQLRTALGGLPPLATTDPITTGFIASPGNAGDDMLAAFSTAMANATVTFANMLNSASAPTFTVPAGFGTILSTAYAGTTSGGGGGGGGAGVCGDTTSIDSFFTSNAGFISVSRTGGNPASSLYQALSSVDGYRIQIVTLLGAKMVIVVPALNNSSVIPLAVEAEDTYENLANEVNILFNAAPAQPLVGNTGVLQCDKTTGTWTLAIAAANSALNNVTLTSSTGSTSSQQMGGAKQGTPLNLSATVTTFAGGSASGTADGTGAAAQFNYPSGVTTDGTNLYIADKFNHLVRKAVIATGVVTTVAGGAGQGTADGTGAAAQFNNPGAITTDGTNLYVLDELSCLVRKIDIASAVVTTLAGGVCGYGDGTGAAARFNLPVGITTDGTNLYVADTNSQTIRQIVIATGVVTTLAGTQYATGTTDATGAAARFNYPAGITTDGTNLYVADNGNHSIRKIVIATGVVSTLAGTSGTLGSTDGTGAAGLFKNPYGITTDGTNLYVADSNNYTIRKVVIATGAVTTLAGSAGSFGLVNGTGSAARFQVPNGITTDGTSLFVAVTNGNIRMIQ